MMPTAKMNMPPFQWKYRQPKPMNCEAARNPAAASSAQRYSVALRMHLASKTVLRMDATPQETAVHDVSEAL